MCARAWTLYNRHGGACLFLLYLASRNERHLFCYFNCTMVLWSKKITCPRQPHRHRNPGDATTPRGAKLQGCAPLFRALSAAARLKDRDSVADGSAGGRVSRGGEFRSARDPALRRPPSASFRRWPACRRRSSRFPSARKKTLNGSLSWVRSSLTSALRSLVRLSFARE